MKKRCLALLLALVQCFSLLIIPANATEVQKPLHFELAGPAEAVHPGDSVTVTVSLAANPGIAAIDLTPTYDKTALTLVSMAGVSSEMEWTTGKNAIFVEATNTMYTGETLKLNFTVNEDAAVSDYTVGLTVNLAANENEEIVEGSATTATIQVAAVPVTGITLDQTSLSLDQGGSANLTATVAPENAGNKSVTWSSDNESVATVKNGLVTAVGAGSATITAKTEDGEFTATCAVTVTGAEVPVTGITLSTDSAYVYNGSTYVMEGNTATLTATVTPDYATDKTVTWSSSDETIATVADGVVTPVATGSATITAKAGEATAECSLTVIDNPFTITADGEPVELQYTGSGTTVPTSLRNYRLDVPTGTDTVVISGSMTNWTVYSGPAIVDGSVMTIDLNTYGRSGDYWKIDMMSRKANGYYGAQHIIHIYMPPCEGEHSFADATCTAPKTCTECYTTEGEALGHDWKETAAKVEAVCETAGTEAVYTCSVCQDTKGGETIAAPGHTWDEGTVTTEPTCETAGVKSFECTVDNCDGTKTEPIDALGHTWDDGTVTKEPTCTEKGVKHFECKVEGCDGAEDEDIPANGHNYVDGYCSVCKKKAPTVIPFTTANHTADGSAIHSKFTGVVGLEVDGVELADWTEWVQGSNYQTQSITIYVAAEDKDKAVTFTLLLADGQAGSGALINQTATVQLSDGVGSYKASSMVIGTGGLAPRLNLNIAFKHELCEVHTWVDATCTTPKTCSVCAATEGEVKPHEYEEGTCKNCSVTVPFTIKAGETALIPVQTDAVNCTMASKDVATFNVTIPADAASVDFSGSSFYLYNAETHKALANNKTSYTLDLTNGMPQLCYRDRTSGTYYHINLLCETHTWTDANCSAPKTCAKCGLTEGKAEPNAHSYEDGICKFCQAVQPNPITGIEVSHPNIEKNEETGAMTMAMVTGASEQINVTAILEHAEVTATEIVVWSSSEETVATVDQAGKVTALQAGTTVITAKAVDASGIALLADGEEVLAQFTLTVADPTEGYTLTMGEDVENVVIGGNVSIPVTIGHTGDVTSYNAFDLTFEYDPAILELTSTDEEITDVKDEAGNSTGVIHVERYGTDLTVGETALTLAFKAIATGDTHVKVTSAKVDIAESALTQDAPDASILDNITLVCAKGYTVTLPTEFTGESSILPGEDYTFTAKDKNYNYDVTATIDGTEIIVTDNEDGTFTIPAEQITGNIVITSTKTGKTFDVTLGDDMTGEATALYMTEYTATLNKADGYNYQIEVTIGGNPYTGFTYDPATGKVTIPGADITGAIVFDSNKAQKTADKHSVEIGGDGAGDVTAEQEATNGKDFTFTVNKLVGYTYTVTATIDGVAVPAENIIDNGDGTYTIKNVTGDLVITVTKTYDMTVEVSEYVTLDNKTMFLVTAKASVDTGKALAYDGTAMYYSEVYGAWSYLVITDSTLSVDDAKAVITLVEAETTTLTQTYDVNESNKVDINDAQLVFDMYNNEYQTFDNATMQKFLKADVNGSKNVNVEDAAAIVAEILNAK